MGKNRIIRILGNIIGNIVVHKVLIRYTNKPESIHHLEREVDIYGDDTLDLVNEFNWNEKDKELIKEKIFKKFKKDMEKHYGDVNYKKEEIEELINETMEDYFL